MTVNASPAPFPALPDPLNEGQRGLWGDMLNTWATAAQNRVATLEQSLGAAQRDLADRPARRVSANGVYPARGGAEYVEWVGSADPSAQTGLDVRDEKDTWINTGAA